MTRRLLLSYLSLTLFVLLLLEVPLAIFFQQRETDRLTADIERDATVLATLYEDALEAGTPPDPIPADDYQNRTEGRVVLINTDGTTLIDTESDAVRIFSTRDEFKIALTGQRAQGTRYSSTLDADLVYVAVPVASGGNVHGALRLTFDSKAVDDRVRSFWWGLAAVGAVILLVVGLFGWALSRSITRPLRRIRNAAARFSQGDLTKAEPQSGVPHELADLEASLNVMATRLDRLLQQQRAFVADASHQLRTPLTALQLRLDNLRSDISDPVLEEDIDASIVETDRLANLVTDLLQLASAEKIVHLEPHNLTQITHDRISTWTAVADQSRIDLHLNSTDSNDLWAESVPGGIEQMLDNILSNAIEAAPTNSTITIDLNRGTHQHTVAITDQGPGLTAHQRTKALDRFWRADHTTPGTGLGLAIVQSLVEASNGHVGLKPATPTGLTVTINLPIASAALTPGDTHHETGTVRSPV